MTYSTDARRATGRTTRMLAEALRNARQRRWVGVITASEAQADALCERFVDLCRAEGITHERVSSNKVYIGEENRPRGEVSFEAYYARKDWDWHTMRGAHANRACIFLTDHYAIEARFQRMLEELHRYDA